MNAHERELDREAGADGPLAATENEIATALCVRFALAPTDRFDAALELAKVLKDYGISYSDLYNGMREPRRQQYDPT